MAGAAGTGALVVGAVNGAGGAATLGAVVTGAWRAIVGRVTSTATLVSPLEPFTSPVTHPPFPCFKRGTIRVVCFELRVE